MQFEKQHDLGTTLEYYYRSDDNGPFVTQYEYVRSYGAESIVASGGETPQFHKRMRRGELLPLQPYSNVKTAYFGSWQFEATDGKSPADTYRLGKPWHVAHLDVPYNIPSGELYVQMAAARAYSGGHDTLTFLAELGKARRMVAQLPKKILRMYRQSPARTLSEFNKLWLEARYGWRIIIFDLEDLAAVMQSLNEARRSRIAQDAGITVRASSQQNQILDLKVGTIKVGTADVVVKTTIEHSRRGTVVADFEPPRLTFNPVVTAWELVPFSFILDWIIDVGTALESLSLTTLAGDYVSSEGNYREITTEANIVSFQGAGAYTVNSASGTSHRYTLSKTREPKPVPKLPRLNIRLDPGKVMDLTALYRELSRR